METCDSLLGPRRGTTATSDCRAPLPSMVDQPPSSSKAGPGGISRQEAETYESQESEHEECASESLPETYCRFD